jgi:D-aminoacyl-tRNA deacylase
MKAVLQRVTSASVIVDNTCIGIIDAGLMVLVGFGKTDTSSIIPTMSDKILGLRIFADHAGKMNLSLLESQGSLLLVPQFTLYGDCTRGRRPGFEQALHPASAQELFNQMVQYCSKLAPTQTGRFGANMAVNLCNAGPVTFVLDSADWLVRVPSGTEP